MGVLNVTPDSFYDGGRHRTLKGALKHAEAMIREGADWIDVGGESTRPGSRPVSESEELRRTVPVVRALRRKFPKTPVSIDTQKSAVALAALDAGASMVNDVSALERDPRMVDTVLKREPFVVLMHMRGEPSTMQSLARYRDVVGEVQAYLAGRVRSLVRQGFPRSKIVVDPGLGFGKTAEHNLRIMGGLKRFLSLGCPVLVGASRKSFIGRVLSKNGVPLPPEERLEGSLAAAVWAALQGASILRVHDVGATRKALEVLKAVRA